MVNKQYPLLALIFLANCLYAMDSKLGDTNATQVLVLCTAATQLSGFKAEPQPESLIIKDSHLILPADMELATITYNGSDFYITHDSQIYCVASHRCDTILQKISLNTLQSLLKRGSIKIHPINDNVFLLKTKIPNYLWRTYYKVLSKLR